MNIPNTHLWHQSNFSSFHFGIKERFLCFESAVVEDKECKAGKTIEEKRESLKNILDEKLSEKETKNTKKETLLFLTVAETKNAIAELHKKCGNIVPEGNNLENIIREAGNIDDPTGDEPIMGDNKLHKGKEVKFVVNELVKGKKEKEKISENKTYQQNFNAALEAKESEKSPEEIGKFLKNISGEFYHSIDKAPLLRKLFLTKTGEQYKANFYGSYNAFRAIGIYDFFKDKGTELNSTYIQINNDTVGRFGINENKETGKLNYLYGKLGYLSPDGSPQGRYEGIETGDIITEPSKDDKRLIDLYKEQEKKYSEKDTEIVKIPQENLTEEDIAKYDREWNKGYRDLTPKQLREATEEKKINTAKPEKSVENLGEYEARALNIAKAYHRYHIQKKVKKPENYNFESTVKKRKNLVAIAAESAERYKVSFESLMIILMKEASFGNVLKNGMVIGDTKLKNKAYGLGQTRITALNHIKDSRYANDFKDINTPQQLTTPILQIRATAAYLSLVGPKAYNGSGQKAEDYKQRIVDIKKLAGVK